MGRSPHYCSDIHMCTLKKHIHNCVRSVAMVKKKLKLKEKPRPQDNFPLFVWIETLTKSQFESHTF
jgi:hypothetical protein